MINRQMQPYVLASKNGLNEYGQPTNIRTPIRTIQAAVMLYQQTNVTNPRMKDATHIALTNDKNIQEGQYMGDYLITLVNTDGRYTQLYLRGE